MDDRRSRLSAARNNRVDVHRIVIAGQIRKGLLILHREDPTRSNDHLTAPVPSYPALFGDETDEITDVLRRRR